MEKLLKVLNHEEPDRVPVDLGDKEEILERLGMDTLAGALGKHCLPRAAPKFFRKLVEPGFDKAN